MEKRISYRDFQSIKAIAKAIDPQIRERESIQKKLNKLVEDLETCESQIKAIEVGIVQNIGFHVSDLVKKVVEVTGTSADGKPIKSTKYVPTDIVSYDDAKKQYVITIPDEEEKVELPTAEGTFGSDYDIDKERVQQGYIEPSDMEIFK